MDVKSSNILMDEALEGKMSDFGISRQNFKDTDTGELASKLVATRGYVDPEYAVLLLILCCQ
jgi:serine/threonine protein kinase